MRMAKQLLAGIVMTLAVSLLLSGCGGGDGDGEVAPANRSPVADAGVNRTVDADDPVTLDGSGSADPDGSIANYQWGQMTGPAVSLSNADQAIASFVAPAADTVMTLVFRLTITDDDGATASDDVSITVEAVTPVNQPPTANAGSDQMVDAGTVVMLIGSGSDSDGTVTGVQWNQTEGTAVSLSMEDQLVTSFVAPEVDAAIALVFRLTVTDDGGMTASDDVSVTVRPIVPMERPFTLDMSRLDDPAFRLQ